MKFVAHLPALALGLAALCLSAHAEDYPTRPVTIVVPFAAGGPTDLSARIVAGALGKATGANFIVENVPGAGATIGATKVAQATPDGYTLLWGSGSTLAMTPHLYKSLRYDPIKSFAPVGLVCSQPFVLVARSTLGVNNIHDFISLLKAHPNKYNFSSTGLGASSHLVAELFKTAASVTATHVPYNGGAPAANAVMAGNVDFLFDTPTTTVPLAKSGKVKALAVTGPKRWAPIGDVPTLQEAGFRDFDVTTWFGMVAPAGTPQARIDYLSRNLQAVLKDPQVIAAFQKGGFVVDSSTPEQFAKKISTELARWGGVIQAAGVQLH